MRTRIISSLAAATLLFSACGGGASGAQGEVADLLMQSGEEEGFDLDKGCVEDVASKLSDDDAKKMVEAGVDGDADISAEGEALAFEMFACVDTDSLVDQMVEDLGGSDAVDVDCVKDAMRSFDPASEELPTGLFDCIEVDG